jgi:hypothetical protein
LLARRPSSTVKLSRVVPAMGTGAIARLIRREQLLELRPADPPQGNTAVAAPPKAWTLRAPH